MKSLALNIAMLVYGMMAFAVALSGCSPTPADDKPAEKKPALDSEPSQPLLTKSEPDPPTIGEEAPDFELQDMEGETISLHKLTEKSPVVLIVLRGWPGYQCPICTRQVGEFIGKKEVFRKFKVPVVMIYPGPEQKLKDYAHEFREDIQFPQDFYYLIDPGYKFTNAWRLRWNAPKETAYPSTFVIGQDNLIKFETTSTTHGGRASVKEVVEVLEELVEPSQDAASSNAEK